MSSEPTNTQLHDSIIVESFINAAKDFDRIMLEAVEAGLESGRSMGVIEAYNVLVNQGYIEAAEILIDLINEENEVRKSRADA